MKATIEINLDNAVFQLGGGLELARLLRGLAEDIENNNACNLGSYIAIIDVNGNKVGEFEVVGEPDDETKWIEPSESVRRYQATQEFFNDTEKETTQWW
jgi:hypothetical protein